MASFEPFVGTDPFDMKTFNSKIGGAFDKVDGTTTKLEQDVAKVKTDIEAMTDPMGPWKYLGKMTKLGTENRIVLFDFSGDDVISPTLNEFFIRINDLQAPSDVSSGYYIYVGFSLLYRNGNYVNQEVPICNFVGKSEVETLKRSVFKFGKVGIHGLGTLYGVSSYSADYSISKAALVNLFQPNALSLSVYFGWRGSSVTLPIDVDFYYR